MLQKIKLIAIDQDGTLLNSQGRVTDANKQAIRQAMAQGVIVIIATGKTRLSAAPIMAELGLATPGVFTQGLVICDGDGSILRETVLDEATAVATLTYTRQRNLPTILYCADRLIAQEQTHYSDLLHTKFHEPPAEIWPDLPERLADLHINKILFNDDARNDATRAELTALFAGHATVTQAVPEFIEVLPLNTSKGDGLRWLLNHLHIDPAHVLAIGDGENDTEMLQMAGVGVAVGNAKPALKDIANAVVATNDDSGVAEAITRFV